MNFLAGSFVLTTLLPLIAALLVVSLLLQYWLKITPVRVGWIFLTLVLGILLANLFEIFLSVYGVMIIATLLAGFSFHKKYQISYWKGVLLAVVGYGVFGGVSVLFGGI